MARVRYRIEASVSSTSAEEKDLGNLAFEVVNDESDEGGTRKTLLAAGATDVSVKLNEVSSAVFLLIKTNTQDPTQALGTIEIKKNAVGGEVTEIVPLPDATEGHMLLSTSGITDLFASNPGTIPTYITVMGVGD